MVSTRATCFVGEAEMKYAIIFRHYVATLGRRLSQRRLRICLKKGLRVTMTNACDLYAS